MLLYNNSEDARFFHGFTGTINHSRLTNQNACIDFVLSSFYRLQNRLRLFHAKKALKAKDIIFPQWREGFIRDQSNHCWTFFKGINEAKWPILKVNFKGSIRLSTTSSIYFPRVSGCLGFFLRLVLGSLFVLVCGE